MPRIPPAAGQYDAPGYGQQGGAGQQWGGPEYPGQQQYADPQYGGNQPYPGAMPYAGAPQRDTTPFGSGQYGGPQQYGQYGSPQQQAGSQYGGHPYGDPQFGGPQYGGPEYGGHPYGDPQFGGPQYGDPAYGGPRARAASRLSALRSRGPLIPIAAVGAVAVIIIVALVAANSGGGTPSTSASQGTQGPSQSASGPSSSAAQRAAATRLSNMLQQSGAYHSKVNAAVGDVESCQHLRSARTDFGASARNRTNLLDELGTMPGRASLPAPLLQDLTGAWQASIQVDGHLHDWAQDYVNGGCNPKAVLNDPNYQESLGPDGTATNDKKAFATAWAPIAAKYGLPAYQASQI
jgi:hypothetical protein